MIVVIDAGERSCYSEEHYAIRNAFDVFTGLMDVNEVREKVLVFKSPKPTFLRFVDDFYYDDLEHVKKSSL